jgi:hypothetical protein
MSCEQITRPPQLFSISFTPRRIAMAETDWIKAAVTTLDEVALAIRDLDKAELTRLCSSSRLELEFMPEIKALDRLFRERIKQLLKTTNNDDFGRFFSSVCMLAAQSVLEGMLTQYKIERKLRKENRDG